MKIKINSQYEIDSNDITRLTFKLTRISEKNSKSSSAFFYSLDGIKSFLTKNYPDLVCDKIEAMDKANSGFHEMVKKFGVIGKHDIKFYIDEFYFISFDKDTYVLYVHPDINGSPTNENKDKKPAPNKERQKVVCFPKDINSAMGIYYNTMLKDSDLEDDKFIEYIYELTKVMESKFNEINELIKQPKA